MIIDRTILSGIIGGKLSQFDALIIELLISAKYWKKKPLLKVSFSGGKTSAYMAWLIKKYLSPFFEIVYTFANTGLEDERTLIFVDRCSREWDLNVVWLEAVVHQEERRGCTHKIVDFETASRNGEPFIEVIKKYGIPNMDFQPCNRELKLNTMKSYMKSIGWKDYMTAIGIRTDEDRRVNAKIASDNNIIYPLINIWPRDKEDVTIFWEDQPFELGLEEHEGNCVTCWKKSDKKIFRLIQENPEAFAWNREMERLYGWHGAPYYGVPQPNKKPRVFFRGYRSTDDMFAQAAEVKQQKVIQIVAEKEWLDRQKTFDFDAGCSESCEMFEMEK